MFDMEENLLLHRVATVREKCLENEIFSKSGKSQGILWRWPGKFRTNLESQGKVRELENKWRGQSSENLFILFKRGKDVLSHEID